MKRYYVDLTHFENLEDRVAAYEQVDGAAFLCSQVFSKTQMSGLVPKAPVLVGLEVSWNSAEDFESSPVYPSGCSCKPI